MECHLGRWTGKDEGMEEPKRREVGEEGIQHEWLGEGFLMEMALVLVP